MSCRLLVNGANPSINILIERSILCHVASIKFQRLLHLCPSSALLLLLVTLLLLLILLHYPGFTTEVVFLCRNPTKEEGGHFAPEGYFIFLLLEITRKACTVPHLFQPYVVQIVVFPLRKLQPILYEGLKNTTH